MRRLIQLLTPLQLAYLVGVVERGWVLQLFNICCTVELQIPLSFFVGFIHSVEVHILWFSTEYT